MQGITTKYLDREISFYHDGAGWVHKTDPCQQARAHQGFVCGERNGKGYINNAVPRARKKGLEDVCRNLWLPFPMTGVIECFYMEET